MSTRELLMAVVGASLLFPGAARLAATTRVPVIPVGIWGTEKVWPRAARVPDLTNVTDPPTIRL